MKLGKGFLLDVFDFIDLDGDNLSFFWFFYLEVGLYVGEVKMGVENVYWVYVIVLEVN